MHLNRLKSSVCICSVLFLFLLNPIYVTAQENFEDYVKKPCTSLLETMQHADTPREEQPLKEWAQYLESVSTYTHGDYITAINQLQAEYSSLIQQTEQCLDTGAQTDNQKISDWIDQMVAHFGPEHLKDKEKSIMINLMMVVAGSNYNCCGDLLAKLFYKEAELYGAYKYYFNTFLDFYKKQSPQRQTALKTRKESTDNVLDLLSRGAADRAFIGKGKPRRQVSAIQAREYDEEIYNYFKEHPPACDIDAFKALEQFRKAINR